MPVQLNHTIVASRDKQASAAFLTEILGLPAAQPYGPFLVADNGVSLDFMDTNEEVIRSQHYAFLISEDEFDGIFARVQERDIPYWADPHAQQPQEINHGDGGRGFYFQDPSGHWLEVLTRPYGSSSQ
jgi:catechol 2,3-dioxygenase-like lactoylglutathione lyase family enzyme